MTEKRAGDRCITCTSSPPIQGADWLSLVEEHVETLTAEELRAMGLVVKEADNVVA